MQNTSDFDFSTHWHHAPPHSFTSGMTYMITAGTYQKNHLFQTQAFLSYLQKQLLHTFSVSGWTVKAWAVFSNHYHLIGTHKPGGVKLGALIGHFHSETAGWINERQGQTNRKVWHQYWDTCLSYQKSYLARLNYIMENPVKHGLVERAEDYPWCSKAWFKQMASPSFQRSVMSSRSDRINVIDDF